MADFLSRQTSRLDAGEATALMITHGATLAPCAAAGASVQSNKAAVIVTLTLICRPARCCLPIRLYIVPCDLATGSLVLLPIC